MQRVPITTKVVSLNPMHGEVYSIPEKDKDGKYKKIHVADVVLLEHSQEKELYFFPGIKVAKPEGQSHLDILGGHIDLGSS
jgi:hypothetical protein